MPLGKKKGHAILVPRGVTQQAGDALADSVEYVTEPTEAAWIQAVSAGLLAEVEEDEQGRVCIWRPYVYSAIDTCASADAWVEDEGLSNRLQASEKLLTDAWEKNIPCGE
jgi:hypothetical protein